LTVSLDTPIAVYVHVPWCASICPYCDFPKQASDFGLVDPFVDAVIRHIEAEPPRRAHSLFFGGRVCSCPRGSAG
jgi:oxygen-independent coproporphyrinogen-3 oxidase